MIWVLLLIALGALLVWLYPMREQHVWARRGLGVGIVLGLLLATGRIGQTVRRAPLDHGNRSMEQALGQVAAEEFARIAGDATAVVIVPFGIVEGEAGAGAEARLASFRAGARDSGLRIVAELSPLAAYREGLADPSDPDALADPIAILMDVGVDYRSVQYAIAHYPQARVIVCLDGVPTYGVGRMPGLDARKILAIDAHGLAPDWARGLRGGQLSAVIAPRSEPGPPPSARRPNPREIFDRFYLLVTADTVDAALPDVIGAAGME